MKKWGGAWIAPTTMEPNPISKTIYLNPHRNQCPTAPATTAALSTLTSSEGDADAMCCDCTLCVCVIPHTMYFWTQCNSGFDVIPDVMQFQTQCNSRGNVIPEAM